MNDQMMKRIFKCEYELTCTYSCRGTYCRYIWDNRTECREWNKLKQLDYLEDTFLKKESGEEPKES